MQLVNRKKYSTKSSLLMGAILTVLGLLACMGFLIAAGVDYRLTEDQGIDPGPTPAGIAFGIAAGFWGFILGLIILGAVGIHTMLRRRGKTFSS